MTITQADPEHFDLFPGFEIFKRILEPGCQFGQFVYDRTLCCLKRGGLYEGGDRSPYCDKNDCPKDKGIKKCRPLPKVCDSCPANPKKKEGKTNGM